MMEVINIAPPNYSEAIKSRKLDNILEKRINPENFFKDWNSMLELPINFDAEQVVSELKLENGSRDKSDDDSKYDVQNLWGESNSSFTPFFGTGHTLGHGTGSTYNWENYYNKQNHDPHYEYDASNYNNNFNNYSNYNVTKCSSITVSEDKYTIFEYIQKLIPDFYDNIEIKYKEFFDEKYNVAKTIRSNDEMFFHKNKFLDDDMKQFIEELYKEYIPMFEQLFDDENHVAKFLKNAMKTKNKDSNSHYFIELFDKFSIFTPTYIGKLYFDKLMEFKDTDKPKEEVRELIKQTLEEKKNKVRKVLRKFRADMLEKTEEFDKRKNDVEYHLSDEGGDYENFETLTVDLMYLVIFYSKKLIKMNVYPIHLLLSDIIKKFVKIDLDDFTHIYDDLSYTI